MSINNKIKIKSEVPVLVLAAVILFFIATNIIWLAIDNMPPSWDDSGHMRTCLLYAKLMPQIKTAGDVKEIFSLSKQYPPLFYISTLPIVYFFGFVEDYMIYINFFYLVILTVSVFGIGRLLFNIRVGVLSALLTLLYPIMFGLSRRYLLDFALVSMVSVVLYLILKYDEKRQLIWGFLLFIAVIISILIKQAAVIFYAPAMCAIIFGKRNKRRNALVLISLVFATIALIMIYYWHTIVYQLGYHGCERIYSKIVGRFCENLLLYLVTLKDYLISPVLLLFFLIGLVFLLIFNRKSRAIFILASCIIPALCILSLMRWQDSRYIIPVLPAFSIITIGGIDALSGRSFKNILTAALIIIGFIQFLNLSFNLPAHIKEGYFHYNRFPSKQDWKIKEILQYISSRFKDRNIRIGILPNYEYFNPNGFALYATSEGLPYSIAGLGWRRRLSDKDIKHCDIVINKIPSYYHSSHSDSYEDQTEKILEEYNFKNIKDFILPDNNKAVVYQRIE